MSMSIVRHCHGHVRWKFFGAPKLRATSLGRLPLREVDVNAPPQCYVIICLFDVKTQYVQLYIMLEANVMPLTVDLNTKYTAYPGHGTADILSCYVNVLAARRWIKHEIHLQRIRVINYSL